MAALSAKQNAFMTSSSFASTRKQATVQRGQLQVCILYWDRNDYGAKIEKAYPKPAAQQTHGMAIMPFALLRFSQVSLIASNLVFSWVGVQRHEGGP